MTIVMSIPSQQYTPRTITQQRNIPASVKRLRFSLTRESWPPGAVGSIGCKYPDGTDGPSITFDGGDLYTDAQGKRVSTEQSAATPFLMTESYFDFGWTDPQTGVVDLPAGLYTFKAQILQTITTAFTVERF